MQEKESIMVVSCGLKIPSLSNYSASLGSLVMPNSYPSDGIFNLHLTTISDSYILLTFNVKVFCQVVGDILKHLITEVGLSVWVQTPLGPHLTHVMRIPVFSSLRPRETQTGLISHTETS